MSLSILLLFPLLCGSSVYPTASPIHRQRVWFPPTVAPTNIITETTNLVTTSTSTLNATITPEVQALCEEDDYVDDTLSTIIQSIYMALAIYLLIVQRLKFKYLPDDIKTFSICKVLNLKRLAYIIVSGTIFKVFTYFPMQYIFGSILPNLPCNLNGRFIFWGNKIFIGFFVALRSRFSLSSTENKWYRFGLLIICSGIVLFFMAILRVIILPDACEQAVNPPEYIPIAALAYDFFGEIYMLAVFIIPMRKTIAVLEAISGGKPNVRLTLWINKVMIYSSIIIFTNLTILALVPFASLCSNPFTGDRDNNCIQLLQNTSLLVSSYGVVVQFDSDIDAADSKRIKWMLRSFDCNNCAARNCQRCCSLTRKAESELAEIVQGDNTTDNTADSGPNSGQSTEDGTVELQTVAPSVDGKG